MSQTKLEEIEKRLKQKLLEYSERPEIQCQISEAFYIWKNDPYLIVEFSSEEDIDDDTFARFMDWFIFDFKTFDKKKTVVERFYDDKRKELSTKELQILKDWKNSILSVFEIGPQKDKDTRIFRDIFTGKEITVHNSNTTQSLHAKNLIIARPIKLANKYYLSEAAMLVPDIFKQAILEYFDTEYERYKKIHGKKLNINKFLKEWGYLIANHAEKIVKRSYTTTSNKGEYVLPKVLYSIDNPDEVKKRLSSIPGIEEIVVRSLEFKAFLLKQKDLTATFEIEKNTLTVRTDSKNSLRKIIDYIQTELGDLIKYKKESYEKPVETKNTSTTDNKNVNDPAHQDESTVKGENLDKYYEKWIDTPLGILGGISPRKAIETEEGRKKLEAALEELENIYDNSRIAGEPFYDVEKIRKRLKEIKNNTST